MSPGECGEPGAACSACGSKVIHAIGSNFCKDQERAQALAAAELAAAERAWAEGYEAAGKVVHPGVNPYRLPKGPTHGR